MSRKKGNLGADLSRKKRGTRQPRVRALIVTEGTDTEPKYFNALIRYLKATATSVTAAPTATAKGVGPPPSRALAKAREMRAAAIDEGLPYDEVWIVFDVDEHTQIAETIRQAARSEISVAITNPCFELWLLLHFESVGSHISSKELEERLKSYNIVKKKLPKDFDYSRHTSAIGRITSTLDANGVPTNPGETLSALVAILTPS